MLSRNEKPERVERVRVAVFTDNFDQKNGVCTTYRQMVAYAERHGLRLDLYCFSHSEGVEERGRVRIHRIKRLWPIPYYENLAIDLAPNPGVFQALSKVKCHVIHVTAPDTLGNAAMMLAKKKWYTPWWFKRPVVGVYHTSLPEYAAEFIKQPALAPLVKSITWGICRNFYNDCDLVLATTNAMRDELKKQAFVSPIQVMGRGVDGRLFHPNRRTAPPPTIPTILYAGRLSVEKNLHYYAEALSRLRASGLQFRAEFAGDGPLRAELEAALPWATFHGFLEGESLATVYANADVFAFPSLTDTFGNVVQEAMASGLPCVVADRKGPGEIVTEGQTGYIAPDATQFEARLAELICEPERRATMGRAARLFAEYRTWDAIFDRLWQYYAFVKRGEVGV